MKREKLFVSRTPDNQGYQICIRVPYVVAQRLQKFSEKLGFTMAELIRLALITQLPFFAQLEEILDVKTELLEKGTGAERAHIQGGGDEEGQ